MTDFEPKDLLHVLARRGDLLDCLWEGVQEKRELEVRLGQSRSTLNRGLNDLEENHLVAEQPDGYAVTPAGEIARQLYVQLCRPFAETLPVLAYLSPEDPLDPAFVRGADVTRATPPNPDAPLDRLRDLVGDCQKIEGMSPIGLARHLDFFGIRNAEEGSPAEFVFDEECLDHLWDACPDEMRTAVESDRCTLLEADDAPPFSLVVVDEATAWLGIHDAEGAVKGAIVNDSDDAVDWARDAYQRYREHSERVVPRALQ